MMLFGHDPQMALWFNEGHSQTSSENDLQKKICIYGCCTGITIVSLGKMLSPNN